MHRREFLARTGGLLLAGAAVSGPFAQRSWAVPARKVRVACIGVAHSHAAGKLETIRELTDEFELVGVFETDDQLVQLHHSHPKYKGVRWLNEQEAFDSAVVDAAVIETKVSDLAFNAKRSLEAGLHVHLEKPGSMSHPEFVQLFDIAQHRKLHIQMGYMMRHNPALQFCFKAVREGWLGPVFEVSGAISKLSNAEARHEMLPYKGGAMFELGCHLIDSLITILGPPQKVVPYSRATRSDRFLDSQLAVFEYPTAVATIRSSIVEPYGNERRHFEVSGENGTIQIRPLEPPVVRMTLQHAAGGFEPGHTEIELPGSPGRYHDQLQEFAAIVRGEHNSDWSAVHDLTVHQAVLRASGLPLNG